MQRSLFLKAIVVLGLALALLIPLAMIQSLISERAQRRDQVREEMARTDAGEQTVAGPVLVIPYTVTTTVTTRVDGEEFVNTSSRAGVRHVLPAQLEIEGKVNPQTRYRGLFQAMQYDSDLHLSGNFRVPAELEAGLGKDDKLVWGRAYLAVGISDNRGIQSVPQLDWQDASLSFEPGNHLPALGAGIHAKLPQLVPGGVATFAFDLKLHGASRLGWLPMGETTRVHLASPWPHPSFVGSALPRQRRIDAKGFEASWESSHFGTNIQQLFNEAVAAGDGRLLNVHESVNLMQPVDIYQQAERSVKYGFLFVMLTFFAFALFEVLKELPIHPVQYGLVGIALALFFLLLIALSEHMEFGLSYLVAGLACVGLLVFYLSHVLRSLWRGLGFGALLGLLYGALYGLLISEDNALLLGSGLLFVLLAGAMVLTRKVDWYSLGERRIPVSRAAVQSGIHGEPA